MTLTYHPFAEAAQVEQLTHDLVSTPEPSRQGGKIRSAMAIATLGLVVLAFTQRGILRRTLFSAASACFTIWLRRR